MRKRRKSANGKQELKTFGDHVKRLTGMLGQGVSAVLSTATWRGYCNKTDELKKTEITLRKDSFNEEDGEII